MTTTTSTEIDGHLVHVDSEGFLTEPAEWSTALGDALAARIGITMTPEHRNVIAALRRDYRETDVSPTLRRANVITGLPMGRLFNLFPGKPAYVAGLPKPRGCV